MEASECEIFLNYYKKIPLNLQSLDVIEYCKQIIDKKQIIEKKYQDEMSSRYSYLIGRYFIEFFSNNHTLIVFKIENINKIGFDEFCWVNTINYFVMPNECQIIRGIPELKIDFHCTKEIMEEEFKQVSEASKQDTLVIYNNLINKYFKEGINNNG